MHRAQMQVEGVRGLPNLRAKIAASGPTVLWHGSLGAMSANFVGHYPWWASAPSLEASTSCVPSPTLGGMLVSYFACLLRV